MRKKKNGESEGVGRGQGSEVGRQKSEVGRLKTDDRRREVGKVGR